jgi:hypothetical protein
MAKARSSKQASPRFKPLQPENRKIDLTKFKPDIASAEFVEAFKPGRGALAPVFFQPIVTLSPTKTIGQGRTNLTIIEPTIVQVDVSPPFVPYAGFDRRLSPHRNPTIQIHFQPSGYGITTPGTYVITFAIEAFGASTFQVAVNPTLSGVTGTGARTLNGQQFVTLIVKNLPAAYELYAYVEQTGGGAWNWFSTRVTYPPLLVGS